MEYKFNKELYSKPSLFKTCYKYLDDFYIHLDQDDTYYYVFIESKSEKSIIDIKEFQRKNRSTVRTGMSSLLYRFPMTSY